MAIVLDAMGSDEHPIPEILAAIELKKQGEEVLLVGKKELIIEKCDALGIAPGLLNIHDAPDIVEMTDKPVESFKKKPKNSMAVGLTLVRDKEAEAFVTAGNTGAAYFNAVTIVRRIAGVSRPALAALIPVKTGKCVFMDTGANADCRPEFLQEFAIMGSVYAGKTFGVDSPKIGLLSNGEEAGKGNQLVKDAYPLLQSCGINFVGNVEPKEIYAGNVHCVVTDGFSGNVFIKSSEAVGKLIVEVLRERISLSLINKIGYLLAKKAFGALKKMMDPSETGAAILLGVNGLVFIGHGRSDARALVSSVNFARRSVDSQLLEALQKEIQTRINVTSFSLN